MLYALLFANIIALVLSHDCEGKNATDCFMDNYCGYVLDKNSDCGSCISLYDSCTNSAQLNCSVLCQISDVPSFARESCSNKDNQDCGSSMCADQINACFYNATCAAIATATAVLEYNYSVEAGCQDLSVTDRETCEDKNQVFLRALTTTLDTYCWSTDTNEAGCSLYHDLLNCFVDNCSGGCDDCSMQCKSKIFDCLFDEDCSVAFTWLSTTLDSFDGTDDPFAPYQLEDLKEQYCADSSTSTYCNSKFTDLYDCLTVDCYMTDCPYKNCDSEFRACDADCKTELANLTSAYPALNDLLPGLFSALAIYYCDTGSITCGTNLRNLINCYGSNCCWDTSTCPDANIENCDHADCQDQRCLEEHCLSEAKACLGDSNNCGDALIAQGQWDHYCTQCMENGTSASACSNNAIGLDCTQMEGSSAMMYLQYYCWQPDTTCSTKVTDLLHCTITDCVECTPDEDFDYCTCTFQTCWPVVQQCFLNEQCWRLIFSDEDGYGFDGIGNAIGQYFNNTKICIPPMPSTFDNLITEYYCNDKDCNDEFWNVWHCIWGPIFYGETYKSCDGTNDHYYADQTYGCRLAASFYESFNRIDGCVHIPDCAQSHCMGFADDCLSNDKSQCYATFQAALLDDEYALCAYENTDGCHDANKFATDYKTRCSDTGEDCPQEYRDFANCIYQECADGTSALPGSTATCDDDGNQSGAFIQSGLVFLLSSVLVMLAL